MNAYLKVTHADSNDRPLCGWRSRRGGSVQIIVSVDGDLVTCRKCSMMLSQRKTTVKISHDGLPSDAWPSGEFWQRFNEGRAGGSIPVTYDVVASSGCWNCTSHEQFGRKQHMPHATYRGKFRSIARIVLMLRGIDLNRNTVARHSCDNCICINPEHISAGTCEENALDAMLRDRTVFGRKHPSVKLSEDDVRLIATRFASEHEMAKRFGVCAHTIKCILSGETWWRITGIPRRQSSNTEYRRRKRANNGANTENSLR